MKIKTPHTREEALAFMEEEMLLPTTQILACSEQIPSSCFRKTFGRFNDLAFFYLITPGFDQIDMDNAVETYNIPEPYNNLFYVRVDGGNWSGGFALTDFCRLISDEEFNAHEESIKARRRQARSHVQALIKKFENKDQ